MKKIVFGLLVIVTILTSASCKNEYDVDGATTFKTESFRDFLWKKQPPVEIEAIINTEFSECENIDKPLILQLCDDNAQAITPDVAQLYVNDKKSENNTIIIDPTSNVKETHIKIVLNKSLLDHTRTFAWNLQVVDNPGFEKINDRALDKKEPWIADTELFWKNKNVANSLRVGTDTTLIILLIAFVVIVFLSRMNNLPFGVKRLYLVNDCAQRTIKLKGAGRVVLTRSKKKQSFFQQLFKRKTIFVTDDFFSSGDVLVEPKFRITTESGKRNGIRVTARNYYLANNVIVKDEEEVIENLETNDKIIIKIQ